MAHQPCYAVVDLETTGNQADYDEIIQIGITFVRNNQIIDQYHSMIKTDLTIPTFIQALTSIEEEMLNQAPYFKEVAHEIYTKIKDCVFVAHNVNFDLNFLKRSFKKCHIHYQPKKVIDTLELFKIAFPTEKSYQLTELAESLGIPLTQAHRADEDAHTTARIMILAFQKFEVLPVNTKKQLYYLSKQLKYQLDDYFFEQVRLHDAAKEMTGSNQFEQIHYQAPPDFEKGHIQFDGDLTSLYQTIVDACHYQYREEQLYMAQIVFEQLMHNEKALIEADTGSGKSLAYLVASLMYYIETGEHVMISTNTKMLQNQLLLQDIPKINEALNVSINATLIKSKQDYISLGLISQVLKDETTNYDVNLLKMQLLMWILETRTGDIQELNLRGGQKMYFEQKIETYVPLRKDFHYYNHIRSNASQIQIGITNHAHLLYSSPEHTLYQMFKHCIIDEAHRLPDYAIDCAIHAFGYADIKYQLGLIGKTENEKLLKQVDQLEQQRILQELDIPPIDVFSIKQDIIEIHDMNEHFFDHIFNQVHEGQLYEDEASKLHYAYDLERDQLIPLLHQYISKINVTLEHFNNMKHKVVKTLRKHLLYIVDQLRAIETGLKAGHLFYISLKNIHQKSTIKIHIKDASIKQLLTEKILKQFESISFVSGTLTFNGSFKNYQKWFEADVHFQTYKITSEHTNNANAHIFVPNDIKRYNYQNQEAYIQTIVEYIARYVTTVDSKCLVLFTSYKMLYSVMDYLNQMAEFEDYVILSQQQSQNYKIVQQFNHFDKAILLGTSTFFEGFDYQAHGIKCVMIAKLPFMNHHAVKPMLLANEFNNVFKDYVLPEAVLRFRQGLGRLLRNENDQGIVVSFDNRLMHSQYRHFFQNTFTHFQQHQGNIQQFGQLLHKMQSQLNQS
ncbi:ATP-dependent helicase [Staphylococcus intermedius]|uniref:helicase C-terminal domain-containing protein n=1 Tax=Staphylococcus intermedius TaxID=1285 RepID=UPI000BBCA275|nr:helicase C-terminal domain-containing protein [Staphylococcus intermedius]PCF64898.1 ATP-dependent helicase [Staphylococcus intermedius]PCF80508.1 ATP-dependent helicase [Staphylococcus intermedius]PCF81858.1 ATP-dependent helicase [Staphylococcus intermedius]PCF88195.1 ATP-dependent helicase [Staphylococcus intermedius]PCF88909.1 ATP-dependent helicase [Staphylococcus intermedius]